MAKSGSDPRSERLLQGIAEQAEQEAERIVSEAELQAGEIVQGAERKRAAIIEEAQERAESQAASLLRKYDQLVETEERKARLKAQETLFTQALQKIRSRMKALQERGDYADILKAWIVEGAIGLSRDEIYVNASAKERELLSEELLKAAEQEAERQLGRPVKIHLSSENPLKDQGVFLSSQNGRLAFNNLVEARLQRYSAQLRRMIYQKIQGQETESE